jgi:hypothetical protein
VFEGAGEEPVSGRRQIPVLGHQDIDDLAILIDRPVQIDPTPSDLDICLIDEPPITRRVPAGPRRLNQQRDEPVHPPVNGHVIDLDPTFDQQLFDISVRQAVTQIPTDRQHDDLWREAEPRKT